jgi:hypothetical protein
MRPNTRCPECDNPVRTARQADTNKHLLLDRHPVVTRNAYQVTAFDKGTAIVQPIPPGTTPAQPIGVGYPEHACPTNLTNP